MILANLAKAIREQNYYAVVLEFLIVIAGVVIGFQITAWNEDRAERNQENLFLSRLLVDVDFMLNLANQQEGTINDPINLLITHHKALNACELDSAEQTDFELALQFHQFLPALPFARATYDEMIATGAFARLSDESLKRQITDLYTMIDDLQGLMVYFRSDLGSASEVIRQTVSFETDLSTIPNAEAIEPGRFEQALVRVRYDFDALCQNQLHKSAMTEILGTSLDRQNISRNLRDALTELKSSLENRITQP